MPDVKVPLLGNVPKGALFAGGLAAVGVAGYMFYKHQKSQAVAATPAVTPPGGYAYGYGYGYGQAGASSAYGYGYGPYGYGFGQYGVGGYGGGYPGYGYGQQTVTAPQNNAQWSQNATTLLVNQGYTGTAVLTALGAYISGRPVVQGSSEDTTIQAAIALEGYPPQPGAGGFPPAVNYQGKSGQGGGNVTVPDVTGIDMSRAHAALKGAGLTFNTNTRAAKPGMINKVIAQHPAAGTKVKAGSYVDLTSRMEKWSP